MDEAKSKMTKKEEDKVIKDVLDLFISNPEYTNLRELSNNELLKLLTQYLQNNPDQRFGQALSNLGIVEIVHSTHGTMWQNEFYTESTELLTRVLKGINP